MGDDGVRFTERELDVMSVLWRRGSGTVSEVREELEDELAYTTVLTVLQILEQKGHVRHEEEGRAYRYFATVDPGAAADRALGRIVDKIFQGSAEKLLARLVDEQELKAGELERMRGLLERRLSGEGERKGTGEEP